jgi:hypothetical protein
MTGKYGKPEKTAKKLFQKDACQWRVLEENSVNLTSGSNWTDLIYENASWKNVLEREQSQQEAIERKANLWEDAGKF